MSHKMNKVNPMTIYITFGLVAAISLIMSTFIGSGMAIWYPALTKPELTIPLAFIFIIRTFLAVMFGFLLYFTYDQARNIQEKWIGFLYSFLIFFLNELFYVLFYKLESIFFHFCSQNILLVISIGFLVFLIRCNRKAIWCFIPYLLWLTYQIPWAFTLWKLNA